MKIFLKLTNVMSLWSGKQRYRHDVAIRLLIEQMIKKYEWTFNVFQFHTFYLIFYSEYERCVNFSIGERINFRVLRLQRSFGSFTNRYCVGLSK